MMTATLIYGLLAFAGTIVLIPSVKGPVRRIGLLDHPHGRKQHDKPTPLSGGPVLVMVFCTLLLGMGLLPSNDYAGLIAGLLILAGLGIADDIYGLPVAGRVVVEVGVILGCLIFWGHQDLRTLGDLFSLGAIHLGYLAVPCGVLCVVGVINAFNLCDGMDGLAGGLALIALCYFAGVGFGSGEQALGYLLALLIGGLLGFLSFNMRTPWRARASVFLGDSGSMCLGFTMCWLALELSQGGDRAISPITAVWILGLPIIDTINVMSGRLLRGRSPFRAGRDHLHHVLLGAGFKPEQVVNLLLLGGTAMGGLGVASDYAGVPEAVMFFSMVSLSATYCLAMRRFSVRAAAETERT